jgi:hypothetical protein
VKKTTVTLLYDKPHGEFNPGTAHQVSSTKERITARKGSRQFFLTRRACGSFQGTEIPDFPSRVVPARFGTAGMICPNT